ncbi:MAG TPA: hypothetical protein PK657_05100 [Legionella sp.]|nr:hypothetical protein [Legionella sp.]
MGQLVMEVFKELGIQLEDYSHKEKALFDRVANQLESIYGQIGQNPTSGFFIELYRSTLKQNGYVPEEPLPNALATALNRMHEIIDKSCISIESQVKIKSINNASDSSNVIVASEDHNFDDEKVYFLTFDDESGEEKEEEDEEDSQEISDTKSQSDDKHHPFNYIECGSFDDVTEDSNQLLTVPNQPNNTNIFENVSAPASPIKKAPIVIDGPSTERSSNLVRPTQESTKILPTVNESKKRKLETEVIPYLQALAEHSKDLEKRKQRESLTNQDNYNKAILAIDNICTAVSALNDKYIKNKITTEGYIKETKKILEANQSDLKKHRGPKELVINLLAFFGTIGIAHALNRFCLFKCHTNSSKIVNDMEASLNRLNPNL